MKNKKNKNKIIIKPSDVPKVRVLSNLARHTIQMKSKKVYTRKNKKDDSQD